jgi:hypothetical protein
MPIAGYDVWQYIKTNPRLAAFDLYVGACVGWGTAQILLFIEKLIGG